MRKITGFGVEKSRGRLNAAARVATAGIIAAAVWAAPAQAAEAPPAATRPTSAVPVELAGRPVVRIRVESKNRDLSTATLSQIRKQIRTQENKPFDPATVEEDYKRVYALRKFSNVEPRVEVTENGVAIIYVVSEQEQIKEIRFRGNDDVSTDDLQKVVNLKPGESVDNFRVALAKESIERLYKTKNFPHAHVDVDQDELSKNGVLVFTIVEGPRVRVRHVQVLGNQTFSNWRIRDQVKTKSWFPLFQAGLFDPEQVESDVASIREFYEDRGFFDVRVDRKVSVSADQKEVMVSFVIDEGPRYVVDQVIFRGNASVPEVELRKDLLQKPGEFYNKDRTRRDIKQIVKVYGPLGFIYLPQELQQDPQYMKITEQRFVAREPGKVNVVYDIHEGKPFRVGRIIVKGNEKTKDKVVLREVRGLTSGQLYNSYEVSRAQDRIRSSGLFAGVTMTPITPPGVKYEVAEGDLGMRDLLVEVREADTGRIMFGAGVTSNLGLLGNITYEQRNFDIGNPPPSLLDWPEHSFVGAGQLFRASLQPGTELSQARVEFVEPWLFDQPYSFGVSDYLSQRIRPDWDENRIGASTFLGHRFSDNWSGRITLRVEDVEIDKIDDPRDRAPEVLALEGHSFLTSIGPSLTRDTTDSRILPSRGTITTVRWEHFPFIDGDFDFERYTAAWNGYITLSEDLLERKTILALLTDVGYIDGDAPFFERFYAGGHNSVRGFRYRGISPRSGRDDDPVGGNFFVTGTAELSFPVAGDILRGVLFTDVGTVEQDVEINTLRASVGFGVRLQLPIFGQLPIALDFGFPISKDDQDDTRLFSFSLGTTH